MVRLAPDRARSSNESRFPPSPDGKWEEAASRPAQEASGWLARPISMPIRAMTPRSCRFTERTGRISDVFDVGGGTAGDVVVGVRARIAGTMIERQACTSVANSTRYPSRSSRSSP
jgi:hypothetical protein